MCLDELNVYFSAMQKYGGSFVSFNELKKGQTLLLLLVLKRKIFRRSSSMI